MAQDAPQKAPRWPKMAQNGPKMATKWSQHGPKTAQDGPQMVPKVPKMVPRRSFLLRSFVRSFPSSSALSRNLAVVIVEDNEVFI